MFIDSCNSFRLNRGEIPKYTNEKQQKSFYLYCMLVKFLWKKDSSKTTARITPHTEYLLLDNAGPCNRKHKQTRNGGGFHYRLSAGLITGARCPPLKPRQS